MIVRHLAGGALLHCRVRAVRFITSAVELRLFVMPDTKFQARSTLTACADLRRCYPEGTRWVIIPLAELRSRTSTGYRFKNAPMAVPNS